MGISSKKIMPLPTIDHGFRHRSMAVTPTPLLHGCSSHGVILQVGRSFFTLGITFFTARDFNISPVVCQGYFSQNYHYKRGMLPLLPAQRDQHECLARRQGPDAIDGVVSENKQGLPMAIAPAQEHRRTLACRHPATCPRRHRTTVSQSNISSKYFTPTTDSQISSGDSSCSISFYFNHLKPQCHWQ